MEQTWKDDTGLPKGDYPGLTSWSSLRENTIRGGCHYGWCRNSDSVMDSRRTWLWSTLKSPFLDSLRDHLSHGSGQRETLFCRRRCEGSLLAERMGSIK